MENSREIYGNSISEKVYRKAIKHKLKQLKKYGDDSEKLYSIGVKDNKVLGRLLNVRNIFQGENSEAIDKKKAVIIGNVKIGYSYYRIAIAMASAANAMGYTSYWFDLNSFGDSTGAKIISDWQAPHFKGTKLESLYEVYDRLHKKPAKMKGFRKLSYNCINQKISEIMTPIYRELPKDIPFIATHVWVAQSAILSGVEKVVNAIPNNLPLGFHLAEGAIHTVQTPSVFLGYKTLNGMSGSKTLNPIPDGDVVPVGHYIDHELVKNLEEDCSKRRLRISEKKAKRVLIVVDGDGSNKKIYVDIIKELIPLINKKKVVLYINVGDHRDVWESICGEILELNSISEIYFNDWNKICRFAENAIDNNDISGIHAFYNEEIFAAVYSTNLLMRSVDILITKPSELAFYPVPKLMIKSAGEYESWGAIRASEIGDGTIECDKNQKAIQMLDLMLNSEDILSMLVDNIVKANSIGTYSGAYKVIELAVKGER